MHLIIFTDVSQDRLEYISKIDNIPMMAFKVPFYMVDKDRLISTITKQLPDIPFVSKVTIYVGEHSTKSGICLPDRVYLPIEKVLNVDIHIGSYADKLIKDGYVVIPALSKKELEYYHDFVRADMTTFPEYIDTTKFVFSAFGALGNPSSFHIPSVRSLRLRTMHYIVPLVRDMNKLENKSGRKLEQLFDRLAIRRKGTTATAESYHRDQSILPSDEDEVLGGWINLDKTETQYFSGVPGTHVEAKGKTGFAKLTDDEIAQYDKLVQKIEIPAGHHFIFYQNMVHRINPTKMKYSLLRLFTGYRLTKIDKPLFNYDDIINDQGVPPLPSGDMPTMYAKMNLIYPIQRESLIEWSRQTFKEKCLTDVTIKGEKLKIVQRIMTSLKDYGFPLYEKYAEYEKAILYPNIKWNIPLYGQIEKLTL